MGSQYKTSSKINYVKEALSYFYDGNLAILLVDMTSFQKMLVVRKWSYQNLFNKAQGRSIYSFKQEDLPESWKEVSAPKSTKDYGSHFFKEQ